MHIPMTAGIYVGVIDQYGIDTIQLKTDETITYAWQRAMCNSDTRDAAFFELDVTEADLVELTPLWEELHNGADTGVCLRMAEHIKAKYYRTEKMLVPVMHRHNMDIVPDKTRAIEQLQVADLLKEGN